MGGLITRYEAHLRSLTDVCTDPWFTEQIAAARAGDEWALRRISGSCLGFVLDAAKRTWHPQSPYSVLDLTQEGNAVLVETIQIFQGATAEEFLAALNEKVESRLTALAHESESR